MPLLLFFGVWTHTSMRRMSTAHGHLFTSGGLRLVNAACCLRMNIIIAGAVWFLVARNLKKKYIIYVVYHRQFRTIIHHTLGFLAAGALRLIACLHLIVLIWFLYFIWINFCNRFQHLAILWQKVITLK